jgi:hypothetical protein
VFRRGVASSQMIIGYAALKPSQLVLDMDVGTVFSHVSIGVVASVGQIEVM